MNKLPKVSIIQLRALIVSTVIGIGIMSLPSTLATKMGNDGWIAILISGIMMLPLIAIIIQIFKINPDKDFFLIGKETLGSVIFTICKLIYVIYFILFLAYVVRNLAELIKAFLLPTTPLEIVILVFIVATSYIACYEIDVIARTAYFIYPIILIFALLIVLISIPSADFTNVLPVFQTELLALPKGIRSSFFSFTGFEMIIFAIPYVKEKEKILKSCFIGIGIVTIIYITIFFMCLIQFSNKQLERLNFPVIQLAKQLDLPGYFLENMDGIVMALWVIVVFSTMAPVYFGAGKVLSKIFNTKSHKYFIWALVPVIYKVALMPQNIIEIQTNLASTLDILAFLSIVIIPVLILSVGYIRKKVH